MRRLIALAAALAALAPASAEAAQRVPARTLQGLTQQNRVADMLAVNGRVEKLTIGWKTRSCRTAKNGIQGMNELRAPFDLRRSRRIEDKRRTYRPDPVGDLVIDVRTSGRRKGDRWSGTLRVDVAVLRDGRRRDTCRLPTQRWRAGVTHATLEMTGDEHDFVGAGRSWKTSHRVADVQAWTTARSVTAEFKPLEGPHWHIDLNGEGRRLTRGVHEGDVIRVMGDGRGCSWSQGTVRVRRVRYDRRGHVRLLDATFEQHCQALPDALRGRLRFRRGY